LFRPDILFTLSLSTVVVTLGIWLGWRLYGRGAIQRPSEPDILARPDRPVLHDVFIWFSHKLYIDEIYEATVIRFNAWFAALCNGLDLWFWNGLVMLTGYVVIGFAWVNRAFDEFVINLGFDAGCGGVGVGGRLLSLLQNGRVQNYMRVVGVALAALALFLMWGCGAS
jgi:NADH-quinone oxidoreductase subunit L